LQTASWFIRNIEKLDRAPMLAYNKSLRDFRLIDPPWAGDIFREIIEGEYSGWDENEDGYCGGWLSSDLREFFLSVGIVYPAYEINKIQKNQDPSSPWQLNLHEESSTSHGQSTRDYLIARDADFIPLLPWLQSLDMDFIRLARALGLAFKEMGAFIPLYYLDAKVDPLIPWELEPCDAANTWGDVLDEISMGNKPELFYGSSIDPNRDACDLYVKAEDCHEFSRRSGIGRILNPPLKGRLVEGEIDFQAARIRGSKVSNISPTNIASSPFFDADADDYPKLLHIAVRAWEHARTGTLGTAKQRIYKFLIERYPDLSASEREAISVIGNWQKSGGRPKTGG